MKTAVSALMAGAIVAALFCASVQAAEIEKSGKTAEDGAPADNTGKPLIVRNPDGTMTVQKAPAPAKTDDAGPKGLTISPQVVVPVVRTPANDKKK